MSRWLPVAVKAGVGASVLAGGFRAVSDDDFARVVLMQTFAHEPRLDPTGTSWLPFPFWLSGAVMRLTSTSLLTARIIAFTLGLLATLLLYQAALLLFRSDPHPKRAAAGAAILASVFPWSARLGVATVPELPTASLTVYAIATLTTPALTPRLLGAAALLVASLSRYEPWFVIAVFAPLCLWDARQDRRHLLPALLATAGPAAWLFHNALAHGDALHFARRVSAYKQALGGDQGLLTALTGYPLSLFREEPELTLAALLLLVALRATRRPLPTSLPRVTLAAATLLAGLTLAALPGGAPTHHAGRALLTLWLLAALYLGRAALTPLAFAWRRVLLPAIPTLLVLGALILRPWYARLDSWSPRPHATTIGAAAARATTGPILLEVRDYAFFAVEAGSGAPWRFVEDRSIDPRKPPEPSSFATPDRLQARASTQSAIVGIDTPTARQALGPPNTTAGPWALWTP